MEDLEVEEATNANANANTNTNIVDRASLRNDAIIGRKSVNLQAMPVQWIANKPVVITMTLCRQALQARLRVKVQRLRQKAGSS